jgi:hypothetical protein
MEVDLQPDLRPTAGAEQSDRPLPELEGSEPQGQKVSADYSAAASHRLSDSESESHLFSHHAVILF